MQVKRSAFAGSWYPGNENQCRTAIEGFVKDLEGSDSGDTKIPLPQKLVGGIVPHAGWIYSGPTACRVFSALARTEQKVDAIVLLGVHMHASSPAAALSHGALDTPLGQILVDEALVDAVIHNLSAAGEKLQCLDPDRFPEENTLEVQYPFIRYFFPDARIIVCAVPPSDMAETIGKAVVQAAEQLGRRILVVGSTDMTHYGPRFGFTPKGVGPAAFDWVAKENDASAIKALERMDTAQIIRQGTCRHNMCCSGAAGAAATAAKKMGAVKGVCLDYATSFDPFEPADFVGYCGVVFGV